MLEPQISEWVSQLLRWVHVITAMAWIGSSFYFIHLDLSLKKRDGLPAGVGGEAWQVHGGGFYNMRKYLDRPARTSERADMVQMGELLDLDHGLLPARAGSTITRQASTRSTRPCWSLSPWQAAAIGIAALGIGWLIYDGLCRSPLGKNDALLGLVLFLYVLAAAWGFMHLFSGRAAFLHTGAMIATWMTGSVFLVIIPNQKKVVAALLSGAIPDPRLGQEAKQRSTHNNYLTLPVVFLMLSAHYPLGWSSRYAVAIIGLVIIAGAIVRHFFNSQHAGKGNPWWTWFVAGACMAAAAWLSIVGAPGEREEVSASAALPDAPTEEALLAIQSRCSMCHAAEPVWAGIATAPKGIRLDTPHEIARNAQAIRIQAVITHAMPPNNLTEMTQDERRAVAAWLLRRDRAVR